MNEEPKQRTNDRGPAVSDGKINYLSVSQLREFATCERKWWLNKVKHIPQPQRKSQEIGIAVHKQLEHYVRTGEDVLGAIARPVKPFIPEPGPGLLAEEEIGGPDFPLTIRGIPLVGYIDLINARRLDQGVVRVTDYKTTSNIAKWAAQAEELADPNHESGNGIQMIGYAVAVANGDPHADIRIVELEHIYTQTKGAKKAVPRMTTVDVATARRRWELRVEPLVARMEQVARATSLDQVKPNWAACEKYGGCPYKTLCLNHAAGRKMPWD